MPVSSHLLRKLQETLGADAADDLATWMEGMDANRGDIAELRHETQLGFARIDTRFEKIQDRLDKVDTRLDKVDARFERMEERFDKLASRFDQVDATFLVIQEKGNAALQKAMRDQTRFFFLAWSVQLAAFVGLYAR